MDPRTLARDVERVQVVDVRTAEEWDAGHIEAAVHIPEEDVLERIEELDRSRPVVTVCHTGSRSERAAGELAGEGFTADSLDGGMQAWAERGLPVVAAGGGEGAVVAPPPAASDEMQRLAADFVGAALAVQEHFGDKEPTEEEVLDFLRRRDGTEPGAG